MILLSKTIASLFPTPELVALWWALSTYTGAFISEIVRSGILSVSKGQTEAAYSLGLRPHVTTRKIAGLRTRYHRQIDSGSKNCGDYSNFTGRSTI